MLRNPLRFLGSFAVRAGSVAMLCGMLLIGPSDAAPASLAETIAMKSRVTRQSVPPTPRYERMSFVPNDPLLSQQWHLTPTGSRPHVNAEAAWARGYTGAGVTIGIVDDGLEWTHPDLQASYNAAASWDFGQGDSDPSPFHVEDNHGTSVAGVAAATGGNGIGVSGAAPAAQLAGLRIDFLNQSGSQFLDATRHLSSGPGAAIDIKNHSYGMPVPYVASPAETAAIEDSAAWGTIHVVSAGNGRGVSGDANKRALGAHPDTIAVAALGSDGVYSSYSNFGANVFVTAPSSDTGVGVTTTDRTGGDGYDAFSDYTSTFGGTSSSSPLAAGVLALAKEANPALDVRMAKHLLALTSDNTIDGADATEESDGGWRTNAAGFRFNQNYGFGLIDADALTLAAPLFSGVTDQVAETIGYQPVDRNLPDAIINDSVPGVLTETFVIEGEGTLEEMLISLDVDHTFIGDLQATLTSPWGTSTRLMQRDISDGANDLDWTFTANAFWGEEAAGEWSLTLEDWFGIDTGVWNGFSATALTGSLVAVPEPLALVSALMGLACLVRRHDRA